MMIDKMLVEAKKHSYLLKCGDVVMTADQAIEQMFRLSGTSVSSKEKSEVLQHIEQQVGSKPHV